VLTWKNKHKNSEARAEGKETYQSNPPAW